MIRTISQEAAAAAYTIIENDKVKSIFITFLLLDEALVKINQRKNQ